MIAEINGKINRMNSNLTERLEDELTGNVFGNLRYLPFNKGLKKILVESIYPNAIGRWLETLDRDCWADAIAFWPYHQEGEIDVKIDFPEVVIGIEVKFHSGLSSDDDVGCDDREHEDCNEEVEAVQQSCNQLARESRMVAQWGSDKRGILLFLAEHQFCHHVYEDAISRGIIEESVILGYLSWQSVLKALKNLDGLDDFEQVMINDLITLLKHKDFEPFAGFEASQEHIDTDLAWKFAGQHSQGFVGFEPVVAVETALCWTF